MPAIPEDRLMQATIPEGFQQVMEGWVVSGVRRCRPALALEGLLGDSPLANKTANLEDELPPWSEVPLESNPDSITTNCVNLGNL